MTEVDIRILCGKIEGLEEEVKCVYEALHGVEEWVSGIKKMLERVVENAEQ